MKGIQLCTMLSTIFAILSTAFGAQKEGLEDGSFNMNALKEAIRNEISTGLEKQVRTYLGEMQEAEESRERTQFSDLLTDLKETISVYEDSAKTSNAIGSFNRPRVYSNDDGVRNITTMVEKMYTKEKENQVRNCADLVNEGQKLSGVHTIYPKQSSSLKVYCDMTTLGGGWTVFQRRLNGSVDFYREWLEYVNGFGDSSWEYWLGLRNLHVLTHSDLMELYIYLEDFEGNSRFARYNTFAVSSEFTDFRIDIGSYHGDAGDAMSHSRGHRFSTKDRDNDNHPNDHCATRYTGGWWYNSCYRANLNGQYERNHPRPHQGVNWNHWKGDAYSLKTAVMMFRPMSFTNP